jgi:hypothetical protein
MEDNSIIITMTFEYMKENRLRKIISNNIMKSCILVITNLI